MANITSTLKNLDLDIKLESALLVWMGRKTSAPFVKFLKINYLFSLYCISFSFGGTKST